MIILSAIILSLLVLFLLGDPLYPLLTDFILKINPGLLVYAFIRIKFLVCFYQSLSSFAYFEIDDMYSVLFMFCVQ